MLDHSSDSGSDLLDSSPIHAGPEKSPPWSATTKLVVALTLVAILAGLVISFRNIVGPLLLSFVLSYLLYPAADRIRRHFHISWKFAVNLIFLFAVILIVGLLIWGGVTIVEQIQSLLTFLEKWISSIPDLLDQLATVQYRFGPFEINFDDLAIDSLVAQALDTVRPMFSQVGVIVGTAASSIAVTLGWTLFVLLISYFILSETQGVPDRMFNIRIPRYQEDIDRLGIELARVWNAFLRGQLIIIILTIFVYSVFLGAFGVRFFYGLAVMAGIARFIPYVGPAITWTAYGLVSFFQGTTIFGLSPLAFAITIVVVSFVIDFIMDNYAVPRLLGDALSIHPAAVLVAALVGASLLGVIGVILAAPVLATAKLFIAYAMRKLSDEDPWVDLRPDQPEISPLQRLMIMRANLVKKMQSTKSEQKS